MRAAQIARRDQSRVRRLRPSARSSGRAWRGPAAVPASARDARCCRARARCAFSVSDSAISACCSTRMKAVPSSASHLARSRAQLLDDDRRQALQRLVEQEQRRVGHQRARDRQHLLLAAGELVALVAPPLVRGAGTARRSRSRSQRPGRAATVRFSSTVSDGKISRSCATQPMPRARAAGAAPAG